MSRERGKGTGRQRTILIGGWRMEDLGLREEERVRLVKSEIYGGRIKGGKFQLSQ